MQSLLDDAVAGDDTGTVTSAGGLFAPEWLDRRLEIFERGGQTSDDDAESGRFATIGFELVVGAIERARPGLSAQSEIRIYQDWIAAAASGSPLLFAAWFNTGVALSRAGDRANAAVAYRNSLILKPNFHAAAINLGLALEAMGQPQEALQIWQDALQSMESRIALLTQKARLLERLGRLGEAEEILRALLALDPDQPDVVHHWVHIRQKTCMWPAVSPDLVGLTTNHLLRHSGPLGILALTDDLDLQREAAANWAARKTEPAPRRLSEPASYRHDRIRIGYLSSDFCRHAMSYLIPELLERHDRSKFEVFGYCSSNDDGSDVRRRIVAAFDVFRVVRQLTDEQAAETIRSDEIDILIDLNGITDGTRLPVLRWRPAPVQATYLGFIGSVPLPELDYFLCDPFVVPPEARGSYRPRALSIGPVYQANDSKRLIGPALTRREVGLPDDRFVLCCFSNHYKITPDMFAAWMSILRRAANAVLWLSTDNQWSQRNLSDAVENAGIDPARLLFAPRTTPELYMSRMACADLYLDTFPYNAGTIASDALRMGLPLLTLSGRSFASRMAGSLLTAIGATEGIAFGIDDYAARAVRFVTDKGAYAAFRAHFSVSAWASTIGDTGRFVAGYEDALERAFHLRATSGGD